MSNATCALEMCFISERGIKKINFTNLLNLKSSVTCFQKTAPTSPLNVLIVQDLRPPHTYLKGVQLSHQLRDNTEFYLTRLNGYG